MKKEHIDEIKAIVILALGMILLASLISFVPDDLSWYTSHPNVPPKNLIRILGAYTAGSLFFVFGFSAYTFVLFLFFWSWNKFSSRDIKFSFIKVISFIVLCSIASGLMGMITPQGTAFRFQSSGLVGMMLADFLAKYMGVTGSYIFLITLGMMALIVTGEFLVAPLILKIAELIQGVPAKAKELKEPKEKEEKKAPVTVTKLTPAENFNKQKEIAKEKVALRNILTSFLKPKGKQGSDLGTANPKTVANPDLRATAPNENLEGVVSSARPIKPNITIKSAPKEDQEAKEKEAPKMVGEYHLPSTDLLEDPPKIDNSKLQSNLMTGAKHLEEALASFGVVVRVADIERGPAITRYELEPAPGVKVQRITTLEHDIALAMSAPGIRIEAPIPGKSRVGIEVPNGASAAVFLKDLLLSQQFRSSKSKLTLCLGKDLAGKPMVADLSEMPHMLIAGTTGSGKTVCVNTIIMSMLYNASPNEVKFVMVDPKMVELSQYNDIPHLLCPTVTDTKKASAILNWVVGEMESRYNKLSKDGVRNIKGYNEKEFRMPYIVVIIDELADLMQVSAKTVEGSIARLAQLSRAVGIHLILATQRPSVDVITGVIKANFPARISFKVASKVDSRTVLDMNGAESLLGKGDMLFIKPGDAKPTRGQCGFVKDEEIRKVIDFIKVQQQPVFDESILKQQKSGELGGSDKKDELYDDAVKLVIETNQASVSILQRRLGLGYTRAARLIDMMEQNGLVGPYVGSKPRDLLVDREQWLIDNMQKQDNKEAA